MQQTISPFLPPGIEEMSRQNLAMIERAMGLFNPFVPPRDPAPAQADPTPLPAHEPSGPTRADLAAAELERLRGEVESLRSQLAVARADAAPVQAARPIARSGIAGAAADHGSSRERPARFTIS